MTTLLPPNVFDSGVAPTSPDEAVASFRQTSGATADIQSSCGDLEDQAKPVSRAGDVGVAPDPQEAIDCIGEIFIGAAKLEPVEIWFENTAYPREDELLYEVLLAMDDPHAPDLIEMPYGLWEEFDPPPLFLQRTG
jgi:hypothetical protein